MPTAITNTTSNLWEGIRAAFTSFMDFIPSLIGAVLLLVLGWTIAKLVGRLFEKALHALKFEKVVTHSGLGEVLPPRTPPVTASRVVAGLAKWFIFLIFIQAAANALRVPQVSAVITSILLFLPNLFIALVILVAGAALARFIGNLVETAVSRMGVVNSRALSLIARYAVFGFAIIAAVNQVGVATNLISILFTGLIGSVALALGLAFGLGGQAVAADITRNWYEQTRGPSGNLRSIPKTGVQK